MNSATPIPRLRPLKKLPLIVKVNVITSMSGNSIVIYIKLKEEQWNNNESNYIISKFEKGHREIDYLH